MGEDKPTPAPTTPTPAKAPRLVSLDAYRGFTMLAMCSGGLGMAHFLKEPLPVLAASVVGSLGSPAGDGPTSAIASIFSSKFYQHPTWGWLADQLSHRDWEGCTAWDLIQPSFMFIVGVAMPFAFALRRERGDSWNRQFVHALLRALGLIAIGVFLDSFGKKAVEVQFIRVLQQIAIGYVIAFLVLTWRPRVQFGVAVLLLVGHSLAFILYGGPGPWSKDTNIGTYLDKLLQLPLSAGGYVTINAISAAATIIFGVLCGELLRSEMSAGKKTGIMILAGLGGLAVGLALSGGHMVGLDLPVVVPAVKKIWTASFGIYAAGWTLLTMAAFYALIDGLHCRRWAFPFVVVGMNSIAIYVVSNTLAGKIRDGLTPFVAEPLQSLPQAGPVIFTCLVVLVEWLFCYWLYRHRIFFKV